MEQAADVFRTLSRASGSRLKVMGSVFLASAAPVRTREEAEGFIQGVRRTHHDATHHAHAYRLGPGDGLYRLHDDGEPGGTAGRPILAAIDAAGLTDLVVVVTRWFGGTKLGTGGLARAYGRAAAGALAAGEAVTLFLTSRLRVSFPHDRTSAVMRAIAVAGARVAGASYADRAELLLEIRRSRADDFRQALQEASRGTAEVTALTEERAER